MDLYAKLANSMEDMSTMFHSRMTQYEEDLKTASNTEVAHKTVASLSKDFTDFKCLVWKTMSALKLQMELLVAGLDRHEMSSRRKVLLLHGLSETEDSDLMTNLVKMFTCQVKISNVTPSDIIACHRLGHNKSKPRPVLIRFKNYAMRSEVWRQKSLLKNSGLTFTEFLTKPRHDMFMDARKYYGMHQCWTSDGKVVIQLPDKSRRKIETAAELRELMTRFPVDGETNNNGKQSATQVGKSTTLASDKRVRKAPK